MVVVTRITGSGQVTIPAEIRKKHNLKAGDRVIWFDDEQGRISVQSAPYTVAELDGIFRLRPGVVADEDFGNIIAEAREEEAARIVTQMYVDDDRA